jgi:hypothetical protein
MVYLRNQISYKIKFKLAKSIMLVKKNEVNKLINIKV